MMIEFKDANTKEPVAFFKDDIKGIGKVNIGTQVLLGGGHKVFVSETYENVKAQLEGKIPASETQEPKVETVKVEEVSAVKKEELTDDAGDEGATDKDDSAD